MNELIGFLIVLFVFFFPLLRKILLKRQKKQDQAVINQVEDEKDDEEEDVLELSFPSQKKKENEELYRQEKVGDFEFHSDLEKREFNSRITKRHLKTKVDPQFRDDVVSDAFKITGQPRRIRKKDLIFSSLKRFSPKQTMVIYSEIIGKSKAFEKD